MNLKTKVTFSNTICINWFEDSFNLRKGSSPKVIIECHLPAFLSLNVVLDLPEALSNALYDEFQNLSVSTKIRAIQQLAAEHSGKEVEFYNFWLSNIACLEQRTKLAQMIDAYTNKMTAFISNLLESKFAYPEDYRQRLLDLGPTYRLTAMSCVVSIDKDILELSDIQNPYVVVDHKAPDFAVVFMSSCTLFLSEPLTSFSLTEADANKVMGVVKETLTDPKLTQVPVGTNDLMVAITKDMLMNEYETDLQPVLMPLFAITVYSTHLKNALLEVSL